MKKYFYRLKDIPKYKFIHILKIKGVRIFKNEWIETQERIDINLLTDAIEERIEDDSLSAKKVSELKEIALERGFSKEEISKLKKSDILKLLKLEEEIDGSTN